MSKSMQKTMNIHDSDCGRDAEPAAGSGMPRAVLRTVIGFARIAGALAALVFCGCQTAGTLPNPPTGFAPGNLAPGDVVKLVFAGASELNQVQKIRPDGKLSLPLIGEVDASGKKLKALQDELTALYKPQLKIPDVVATLESSTVAVNVTGEVLRPGKVALDRPLTLLEAIMEAGGVTPEGTLRNVLVIRTVDGKQYTQYFDLTPAFRGKTTSSVYLRPYDMIVVPESLF